MFARHRLSYKFIRQGIYMETSTVVLAWSQATRLLLSAVGQVTFTRRPGIGEVMAGLMMIRAHYRGYDHYERDGGHDERDYWIMG